MPIKFNYPKKLTTLPEYTAHAGQLVTILRQCTNEECDPECQPIYLIQAEDGWQGHANLSELEIVADQVIG